MKCKLLFFAIAFLSITQAAFAQSKLDAYVKQGFVSNENIRQRQFMADKHLYALQEARLLFSRNVSFNITYTLAGAGRTVDFPVGDLLSPVCKSLHQLTSGSSFPQVENQGILLNQDNFYDIKLHSGYRVTRAELEYNKKIKSQQYYLKKIENATYKRELVKEIKIAYYNYLQAIEAIEVCKNALLLVNENAGINVNLFSNQKINSTAVVRRGNEVTKVSAQLNTAKQHKAMQKRGSIFYLISHY